VSVTESSNAVNAGMAKQTRDIDLHVAQFCALSCLALLGLAWTELASSIHLTLHDHLRWNE